MRRISAVPSYPDRQLELLRSVPCRKCVRTHYETSLKIHRAASSHGIEARLASLEDAVRELCEQGKARASTEYPGSNFKPTVQGSSGNERGDDLPEGPSSFSRQTLEAAGVEELVSSATSTVSTVKLELENLRSLANSRGGHNSPGNNYRSGPREPSLPDRELPPVGLVLQVLRELRESQGKSL